MRNLAVAALAALSTLTPHAHAQCVLPQLPESGDTTEIATSVAGGETWLFVGEAQWVDPVTQVDSGSVEVYRRAHETWLFEQRLVPSTPISFGRFGAAIDADGPWLAVGAPSALFPNGQGRGFIFELVGGTWVESQVISPSFASGNQLGSRVAIDFPFVALSDPDSLGFAPLLSDRIEVHRFDDTTLTWVPDEQILPIPGTGGPSFGSSIAIEAPSDVDATLVVGAATVVGGPFTPSFEGVAYIFGRDAVGGWNQEATFGSNSTIGGGDFATDVDINFFSEVVIGAPGATVGTFSEAGNAFVVRDQNPSGVAHWSIVDTLQAPILSQGGRFGRSVNAYQNRILVGDSPEANGVSPQVHLFERLGGLFGSWQAEATVETQPAFFSGIGPNHRLQLLPDSNEFLAVTKSAALPTGVVERFELLEFGFPFPGTELEAEVDTIALDLGGTQCLRINVGSQFGGDAYWLLGSASGDSVDVTIGGVEIPLTLLDSMGGVDFYLNFSIKAPDLAGPPLFDSLGSLDHSGRAVAVFQLPPNSSPALAGLELNHAALIIDFFQGAVVDATGAVPLRLEAELPPDIAVAEIAPFEGVGVDLPVVPTDFTVTLTAVAGASPIVDFTWDFDDGAGPFTTLEPTAQRPLDLGTFDVTVTANALDGSSTSLEIPLANLTTPFAQPSIVTPGPYSAGQMITLSGSGSFDADSPGEPLLGYDWSLQDSSGSITAIGSTDQVEFDWTIPLDLPQDNYTIRLSVIDDDGQSSGNLGETELSLQ